MSTRQILTVFIIMVMAGLVGCTGRSVRWYHPDKTLKEAKRACRECHYQAQAEAILGDWWYMYREIEFDRCMKHKGYRLVPEDELRPTARKRLFSVASEFYPIAGN